LRPGALRMRGCGNCGRIYAPTLAPSACGECGGELRLLALVDAIALAHGRQDRLRRERVQRLTGVDPSQPHGGSSQTDAALRTWRAQQAILELAPAARPVVRNV
jgi:hypothetical protein